MGDEDLLDTVQLLNGAESVVVDFGEKAVRPIETAAPEEEDGGEGVVAAAEGESGGEDAGGEDGGVFRSDRGGDGGDEVVNGARIEGFGISLFGEAEEENVDDVWRGRRRAVAVVIVVVVGGEVRAAIESSSRHRLRLSGLG